MCLKELGFGTIAYSSALFNTSSSNKYEGKSNISILNNYFILNIPCQKLGKDSLFPFTKKHSLKKKCFLFFAYFVHVYRDGGVPCKFIYLYM
jgi:hypothetical protein